VLLACLWLCRGRTGRRNSHGGAEFTAPSGHPRQVCFFHAVGRDNGTRTTGYPWQKFIRPRGKIAQIRNVRRRLSAVQVIDLPRPAKRRKRRSGKMVFALRRQPAPSGFNGKPQTFFRRGGRVVCVSFFTGGHPPAGILARQAPTTMSNIPLAQFFNPMAGPAIIYRRAGGKSPNHCNLSHHSKPNF